MDNRVAVFINTESGSASLARKALEQDSRIRLVAIEPAKLSDAIDDCIKQGSDRILVCGGDGTIALCASKLVGTDTFMGVIPGGTLNHFAHRHGIPIDPIQALDIALASRSKKVDVAYINDQLFINTSSIGAYVHFVRSRNHFRQRLNYYFASAAAGMQRLIKLRSMKLNLLGEMVRTPLVFVGVGERDLRIPAVGAPAENGEDSLHVLAIRSNSKLSTLFIAIKAMFMGVDPLAQSRQVESALLHHLEINFARKSTKKIVVSVDGELLPLTTPLQYRYAPDALNLLVL